MVAHGMVLLGIEMDREPFSPPTLGCQVRASHGYLLDRLAGIARPGAF